MSRYDEIHEIEQIIEVEKFNPYHDARGRFATANNYTSFTYKPGKSKAHDLAIAREQKRQNQSGSGTATQQTNSALVKPNSPVQIQSTYRIGRNTMSGASYYTKTILEASEAVNGQGDIVLSYANPKSSSQRHNGNVDNEYELYHGLYPTSNSSGINRSIGIDWSKVKTVSGQTYDAKSFLHSEGFVWDSQSKKYVRPGSQNTTSRNGVLNIPAGGSIPSDLTGITRITGNTYANRAQIKAAGFKWDPASKEWVKPGVGKSAYFILLDDEPDFKTQQGKT